MEGLFRRTFAWIMATGILSVIVGTCYVPLFSWYVLGQETEGEITLWGMLAIGGGGVTLIGGLLLPVLTGIWRKSLLIIGVLGMIFMALAQIMPIILNITFYGRAIAETMITNPAHGGILMMLPHIILLTLSIVVIGHMLRMLSSKESSDRLNKKQAGIALTVIASLVLLLYGYDKYLDYSWVTSTYPANGAVHVPLHESITVTFEEESDSGGLMVQYADDLTIPIQGVTGFNQKMLTFTPDLFLPGKTVEVTALAGRRSHTFTFQTASAANQDIDLYRSVLNHYFRPPQNGTSVEVVALDTTALTELKDQEKEHLAKGMLAYIGEVAVKTSEQDYHYMGQVERGTMETSSARSALYLTLEQAKAQGEGYSIVITAKRNGKETHTEYVAIEQNGRWEITPTQDEPPNRPWG
ncbi:Ig-like domain-containing protein [Brevibacillus dissolubilis]|uniref:Ig-like domain-containing protein n=1 Tax=Brevibacillus dissolubilis TaxID=1844116 RepID=UPI0011162A21|nr:Ig-like domain-containing protein [Brevibacillus dissolubilis]